MPRTPVQSNRLTPSGIPVLQRDWYAAVSQWGRWTHPSGYRHPAVVLTTNILNWVETGAAEVQLGTERFLLEAGMLAFFPANRAFYYQVGVGAPFQLSTVHFEMSAAGGVSLEQLGVIPRCVPARDPQQAAALLAMIEQEIGSKHLAAQIAVNSALWQLLAMMSEAGAPPQPRLAAPHGKAYEAMALIEANFAKPTSIKEIAHALRITPDYLATVFEQTFGLSPKLQIRNLRMVQAYSLLIATDKSVKEIAYEVGFQSPGVFERAFHQFFKSAPQEIRSKEVPTTSGPVFSYRSGKRANGNV